MVEGKKMGDAMAVAEAVREAVKKIGGEWGCSEIADELDLAALVEAVRPGEKETVNQQTLAEVVALLEGLQKWINKLPVPTAGATHQMMHVVGKAIDALNGMKPESAPKRQMQESEINDEWHAHGGKVTGNGSCFVIGKWDYHKLRRVIAAAEAAQPASARQQGEPVAWRVMNGVHCTELFVRENNARNFAADNQKRNDLSGSLAAFRAEPLYTAPPAPACSVPDGWKLVPIEPTREMFQAVNKEDDKAFAGGSSHGIDFETSWAVALDAAPKPEGGE